MKFLEDVSHEDQEDPYMKTGVPFLDRCVILEDGYDTTVWMVVRDRFYKYKERTEEGMGWSEFSIPDYRFWLKLISQKPLTEWLAKPRFQGEGEKR